MVAIVSNKGMMFKGLINYLYEGKLADRGTTNKQAEVIIYSDNLRIPYGVEDDIGRKRLIEDFIDQAKSHKNYGDNTTKYVGEHILSFKKGEIEKLGIEKIAELCHQYVKDAGIDKTQYLAVSHGDTDIFHIHIVFNRSQNDRTLYPEWKEKIKAAERAVAITLKYGLELTGNQEKLADTKGVWEARIKHQDILDLSKNPMLKKVRNLKHLEKICEAHKILFSSEAKKINLGNQTFLKRDLDVIFFMNRQGSAKMDEKNPDKTQESKYNREKNNKIPAHKIKKEKFEKNQDEREKKESECQEQIENIPFTHSPIEENQDFSYRKAWGKDDKDENTYMKRRKKW
jgi:Relaxase/Mobilisation nuclease domain